MTSFTRTTRGAKKARTGQAPAAGAAPAAAPGAGPFRPNVSRRAVRLGDTAYEDLARAFGGNAAALVAIDRFRYLRALRERGALTDWPDGEDDYAVDA